MIALLPQGGGGNEGGEHSIFPLMVISIAPKFSSVQSLSHVRLFATPWTAAHQASLSIIILEFTQIHVH